MNPHQSHQQSTMIEERHPVGKFLFYIIILGIVATMMNLNLATEYVFVGSSKSSSILWMTDAEDQPTKQTVHSGIQQLNSSANHQQRKDANEIPASEENAQTIANDKHPISSNSTTATTTEKQEEETDYRISKDDHDDDSHHRHQQEHDVEQTTTTTKIAEPVQQNEISNGRVIVDEVKKEDEEQQEEELNFGNYGYSNNVTLNIRRGLNIINHLSGLEIASKVYVGKMGKREKAISRIQNRPIERYLTNRPEHRQLTNQQESLETLKANSTIFVHGFWLKEFTERLLPKIKVDFVLMSARYKIMPAYPGNEFQPIGKAITDHPNLLKWFMLDIGNYTGGYGDHPKVSPFPLGLKQKMGEDGTYRDPVPVMRTILKETMDMATGTFKVNKTNDIFVAYLRITNDSRRNIPHSTKPMPLDKYLRGIAQSKYVLSPDGLFPECHRHYESLGLGAIPITELKLNKYYQHLENGPVIYNNHEWNLTTIKETLPNDAHKNVNRNIIYEEYWMEYVEKEVGRPLLWWDIVGNQTSQMSDFQFVT